MKLQPRVPAFSCFLGTGHLLSCPPTAPWSGRPDLQVDHVAEHVFILDADHGRQLRVVEKLLWVKEPAPWKLDMDQLESAAWPGLSWPTVPLFPDRPDAQQIVAS